jgi:ATP-dependent Clp protease ATP-binding subunit ClpC
MEEGRLTDNVGRVVDFKNCILIMTSNIGADAVKNQTGLGFRKASTDSSYDDMKRILQESLDRHFRPEFLNRLDDIIVFRNLDRPELAKIVLIELDHVRGRLADRGLQLTLTDEAIDFLIEKGYNPEFGARPLKRAIEHHVEDPLAEEILRGAYKEAHRVMVTVRDGHLYFEASHEEPTPHDAEGALV